MSKPDKGVTRECSDQKRGFFIVRQLLVFLKKGRQQDATHHTQHSINPNVSDLLPNNDGRAPYSTHEWDGDAHCHKPIVSSHVTYPE